MGKFNRYQSDKERYGKCEVCHQYLPIESYFCEGDQIVCYQCNTKHTLQSFDPVMLAIVHRSLPLVDEIFTFSQKTLKKNVAANWM